MEKKNMVLLTVIAVATLLVAVVGATFAYFTAATATDNRTEGGKGEANIGTATETNNTITMTDTAGKAGSFNATNVYPGHKEVAELSVTVKTTNDGGATISVPFIYKIDTNDLGSDVKIRLYRTQEEVKLVQQEEENSNYFGCIVHTDTETPEETHLYEKCEAKQENSLGTQIGTEKTTKGGPETIDIAVDTITVNDTQDHTYYYYVVIEYADNDNQDTQQGKSLKGTISVA